MAHDWVSRSFWRCYAISDIWEVVSDGYTWSKLEPMVVEAVATTLDDGLLKFFLLAFNMGHCAFPWSFSLQKANSSIPSPTLPWGFPLWNGAAKTDWGVERTPLSGITLEWDLSLIPSANNSLKTEATLGRELWCKIPPRRPQNHP